MGSGMLRPNIYRLPNIFRENTPRIVMTILSGIGIGLVLVAGPYVQSAFTSFLSGNRASLYGGMYDQGIGGFPLAIDYIRSAFWMPYLASGLITSAAMTWARTRHQFFIAGSLAMAVCLTILDLTAENISVGEILICTICNVFGGILLTLFSFVVATYSYDIINLPSWGNKIIKRLAWATLPFIGYVTLACALFLILSFIINIPSTPVSMRVEPPVNGYYLNSDSCGSYESRIKACSNQIDDITKKSEKFDVLGKFSPIIGHETKWTGEGKNIALSWHKGGNDPAKISIIAAQGCISKDGIARALKFPPFKKSYINGFDVVIDNALSEFSVIDSDYAATIELTDDSGFVQFSVIPSDDANDVDVHRFLGNGTATLKNRSQSVNYEIGLYPFDSGKSGLIPIPRIIKFRENGADKTSIIDINVKQRKISRKTAVQCKPLNIEGSKGSYKAIATEPYLSLIISIEHPELISFGDADRTSEVKLSGLNGFFWSDGHDRKAIGNFVHPGELSQLSIFGAIKDVQVDGIAIPSGSTSTLQLSGRINGRIDGSSALFSGDADFFVLNGKRLTSTRWEQLDIALKVPIILGVPAAVYFIFRLLMTALRRKSSRVWMIP